MTLTSATGRADRRRAGFTLIELMVTLVIIGLATSAVLLTAPDPRPTVAHEAERLAARLVRAREEAILTNRPVAVVVDAAGYRFTAFDGQDWVPLLAPFTARTWGEEVVSTGAAQRIVFDPTGGAEPADRSLSRDGRSMIVRVDGGGEVSIDG